ncbi:LOW QUALITY PROTEIN: SUN domain-containing protein 1-like [Dioscorea cayenensis subsp. rotundata]|uniref:LOW QUALITY PROTEIN: SUN domain-containing protein 1-like n=1 Tax=Dioscorea cayennensis subsp. rotundata TaxID=55577 RepID=A0AB40CAI1_DIOCR|nr:LOW QUALITY PROTEIN: SUN domain-containing protein 1-like [Dioscorea cayenensis subsp. rotundata]
MSAANVGNLTSPGNDVDTSLTLDFNSKAVLSQRICSFSQHFCGWGQTIYGWTNGAEYNDHSPFASLDYETQVSNLESSVKKMTAMLQVQLEVLDKKIENGIGLVKRDLKKEIEERTVLIENELKELEGRTNSLGRSLGELKEMGLLSKEEFESFLDELKKSRNFEGSGNDVSLDEIRVLAKAIVEKEIEKHAADGIGRPDYALASSGARIVGHSEPCVFGRPSSWLRVPGRNYIHQNAKKMLEPSFGEPGQCFALKGSTGFVDIKLRTAVFIKAITLEHVSESVSYDRSSAPKTGRVFGWIESEVTDAINETQSMVQLLDFEYDLEKNNVQTFDIDPHTMTVVDTVRLEVTSNHGNSIQTCIYRLRVHGFEANPVNKVLASH